MQFAQEVLVAADASTQDGVGHAPAFGADGAGGQSDDERDAAIDDPVEQIADRVWRRLDHAGDACRSKAIEQIADRDADRQQHPDAIDPAVERRLEVGLKDSPVRQKAIDPHPRRSGGSRCIHVTSSDYAAALYALAMPRDSSSSTRSRNACSVCMPTLRMLMTVTLLSASVMNMFARAFVLLTSSFMRSSRRRCLRFTTLKSGRFLIACIALVIDF